MAETFSTSARDWPSIGSHGLFIGFPLGVGGVHVGCVAMLDANALTKRYQDVTALNALTLSVAPGEVFCLLGANGAGKTTTINLFLNFVQPTSGARRDQRD